MAATAETAARPTPPLDPSFPRGPFHIARAKGASWQVGLRPHFAYRDLGIDRPTAGKVLAQVIRARQPCPGAGDEHRHDLDFQMVYLLSGWMRTQFEGVGECTLEAGDCLYQKPGIRHRVVAYSDDLELLEITIPADFETETTAA